MKPLPPTLSPSNPLVRRAPRRLLLAGLGMAGLAGCAVGSGSGGPGADGPGRSGSGTGGPAAAPLGAPTSANPAPSGVEEVPYVQTPQTVVDAMLGLAAIHSGDRLIDLGSGDGRVVIAAARQFGVEGLGVEIDPALVTLSRERAQAAGVAHLARFATQDLFETDLSAASVITLYLLPDVNLALRPRLLRLKPGTRIVSHDWDMDDWPADRRLTVPAPGKPVGRRQESTLHLWIVPAPLEGRWQGAIEGMRPASLNLSISQRFQALTIDWQLDAGAPDGLPTRAQARTRLAGDRASFVVAGSSREYPVLMRWREGVLEGSVSTPGGTRAWRATAR